MVIGQGAPEEWRWCAKAITGAEDPLHTAGSYARISGGGA